MTIIYYVPEIEIAVPDKNIATLKEKIPFAGAGVEVPIDRTIVLDSNSFCCTVLKTFANPFIDTSDVVGFVQTTIHNGGKPESIPINLQRDIYAISRYLDGQTILRALVTYEPAPTHERSW